MEAPQVPKMNVSETIIGFIAFLSDVRSMFRQTHLFVEKERAIRDVSTLIEPFKGEESQYADCGVTLSIALNANLRNPPNLERRALGMSLLIRRSSGTWIAEAEVGWSGNAVGWDPFASRKIQSTALEDVIANVPALIAWMDSTFRSAVAELPRS
jgi:hypothetical protein